MATSPMSGATRCLLIALTHDPALCFIRPPDERPADERDAILPEDTHDLCLVLSKQRLELLLSGVIPFAHAHGNLVRERDGHTLERRHHDHLERHRGLLGEVPGQRAPDDREVDLPGRDVVDDLAGILGGVVDGQPVRRDVPHQVLLDQRVGRRRGRDDADPRTAERVIVPRADLELPALDEDEGVARTVIGRGPANLVVAVRHADYDVALIGPQRVANEATPVRPPRVGRCRAEIFREERRDLVLEAFELVIGVGEIVRVGADAERRGRRLTRRPLLGTGRRGEREAEREHDGEDHDSSHAFQIKSAPLRLPPARTTEERAAPPRPHRRRARVYKPYGSEKTVSTPPSVVYSASFLYAPTAPSPSLSPSRPAARPIPAQPPTPDRMAMYCLPSGPM